MIATGPLAPVRPAVPRSARLTPDRWTLGRKLFATSVPFLVLALLATLGTLWMSRQLDGGAAALNEAGRLRMQVYRLAWLSTVPPESGAANPAQGRHLRPELLHFAASLARLRMGDPQRPLVLPVHDAEVALAMTRVESGWQRYLTLWVSGAGPDRTTLDTLSRELVGRIEQLVQAVERHQAHWARLVRALQTVLVLLGALAALALFGTGYRFVLGPVRRLHAAMERLEEGDFTARVTRSSSDEFGRLADGFNAMAGQLQSLVGDLSGRVAARTAELDAERARLEVLYAATLQISAASTMEALAGEFLPRVRAAAGADGALLRWSDPESNRHILLAADNIPDAMRSTEQCIRTHDCHCGPVPGQRSIRIMQLDRAQHPDHPCAQMGWNTVVSIPVVSRDRLVGEIDLFWHTPALLPAAVRTLVETLARHLATGLENLRLAALDRESAVAEERSLIARELHDSIAQSLAFLGIQVQVLRTALDRDDPARTQVALAEIETGIRESHADVRELLVHFRTRTDCDDIEPALQATLRKFTAQSGVPATLELTGNGLPLPPDVQIQALHVVLEALSNVRKHAQARSVQVRVVSGPAWVFTVLDDGIGFDGAARDTAGSHVGLRIMDERAARIGAQLTVTSEPGAGTCVALTLPGVHA